jgi:hypothetical protein
VSVENHYILHSSYYRRAELYELDFESGKVKGKMWDLVDKRQTNFIQLGRILDGKDSFISYNFSKSQVYWISLKTEDLKKYLGNT